MTTHRRSRRSRPVTAHKPVVAVVDGTTASRLADAHETALQQGLRMYQTMFERGSLGQLLVDFPSFCISVVNKAF
jgi:hypothetical protein